MVLDCRVADALHRRPPISQLATGGALCTLDLSRGSLGATSHDSAGDSMSIAFAGGDLVDGYFQFEFPEVAGYFCIQQQACASESRAHVDELHEWVDVLEQDMLWPAFTCPWVRVGVCFSVTRPSPMLW
jgi:hypothetical protein